MADEKQDDFSGVMLGLVEFNGEPGVGIKVGNGNIVVFPIDYMVKVFDQLGEILHSVGALDDDDSESEDDDDEGRIVN